MRLLMLALLVVVARDAYAGPYCGQLVSLAPADDEVVPPRATVTLHVEDAYYNGERTKRARVPKVRATIDGKAVAIKTRDERTADGVLRFITIKSRRLGKLRVTATDSWGAELASTYTIADDWAPITPVASIERVSDDRLGPYRWLGTALAVRVDAPAVAFRVKQGKHAQWVAPVIKDNHSEAWLGQRMCGMVANFPLAALEKGVDDVEISVLQPDGEAVVIREGLPAPLALPPKP
jgi:hypothetical protein